MFLFLIEHRIGGGRAAHVTSDCEGMRRQHILRMISPLICLAFVIT
jgi:hypothetical protein